MVFNFSWFIRSLYVSGSLAITAAFLAPLGGAPTRERKIGMLKTCLCSHVSRPSRIFLTGKSAR